MKTENMNPKSNQMEEQKVEASHNKPKVRSAYLSEAQWKKIQLIKSELGSWNRFADVAIEQLLASGLISKESREAIKSINEEYGLDYLDDTGWRGSFEIQEPWAKTATHLRGINEGVAQLNTNLKDLAQAVEDHAMAMLEAELVKPDDTEQ